MPKIDTNQILMAILGSLVAYVFYGHIALEAKVSVHDLQLEQDGSELNDIWGKYNSAGEQMMNFMIRDAREKEELKEEILTLELKESERWLEYWKAKAQE